MLFSVTILIILNYLKVSQVSCLEPHEGMKNFPNILRTNDDITIKKIETLKDGDSVVLFQGWKSVDYGGLEHSSYPLRLTFLVRFTGNVEDMNVKWIQQLEVDNPPVTYNNQSMLEILEALPLGIESDELGDYRKRKRAGTEDMDVHFALFEEDNFLVLLSGGIEEYLENYDHDVFPPIVEWRDISLQFLSFHDLGTGRMTKLEKYNPVEAHVSTRTESGFDTSSRKDGWSRLFRMKDHFVTLTTAVPRFYSKNYFEVNNLFDLNGFLQTFTILTKFDHDGNVIFRKNIDIGVSTECVTDALEEEPESKFTKLYRKLFSASILGDSENGEEVDNMAGLQSGLFVEFESLNVIENEEDNTYQLFGVSVEKESAPFVVEVSQEDGSILSSVKYEVPDYFNGEDEEDLYEEDLSYNSLSFLSGYGSHYVSFWKHYYVPNPIDGKRFGGDSDILGSEGNCGERWYCIGPRRFTPGYYDRYDVLVRQGVCRIDPTTKTMEWCKQYELRNDDDEEETHKQFYVEKLFPAKDGGFFLVWQRQSVIEENETEIFRGYCFQEDGVWSPCNRKEYVGVVDEDRGWESSFSDSIIYITKIDASGIVLWSKYLNHPLNFQIFYTGEIELVENQKEYVLGITFNNRIGEKKRSLSGLIVSFDEEPEEQMKTRKMVDLKPHDLVIRDYDVENKEGTTFYEKACGSSNGDDESRILSMRREKNEEFVKKWYAKVYQRRLSFSASDELLLQDFEVKSKRISKRKFLEIVSG